jgi:hypothetical protein
MIVYSFFNVNCHFIRSMSVELIGPYYGDSYGGHGSYTAACGWTSLTIGQVFTDGRAAPIRIDRNGIPIAWAPISSIRLKETPRIESRIRLLIC